MHEYIDFSNNKVDEFDENKTIEFIKKIKTNEIKLDKGICITADELKYIDSNLSKFEILKLRKTPIFLYLKYPTEISYEDYKKFYNKYNLYHLFVDGFSKMSGEQDRNYGKADDIDPNIMRIYLKKLNDMTKDILFLTNEYKRFCILCNRIVENVFYDINMSVQTMSSNYKSRYNVPNEILGIIDNKCVCRGYAGILRDACKIMGTETTNIYGISEHLEEGHEWNQVKLNDSWHNVDITWERKQILDNSETYWFLTSNADFYKFGYWTADGCFISHADFKGDRTNEKNCIKSVPKSSINDWLYCEEKEKQNWLQNLLRKVTKKEKGGIER